MQRAFRRTIFNPDDTAAAVDRRRACRRSSRAPALSRKDNNASHSANSAQSSCHKYQSQYQGIFQYGLEFIHD
jgi:hypothetical protein